MRLAVHPLAELFPLIEGDEFLAMAEDIREHGVRDRIELLDGAILDGRNRYNVLLHLAETGEVLGPGWGHRAGEPLEPEHLEPDNAWFHKFNRNVDGDPLPWVLSKNLKRRHLDESQRAMVAAKLKTMNVGRPPSRDFEPAPDHIPPIGGISAQAAAAMLNVGTRSVERAAAVLKDGAPDLRHAVEQGHVAVSTAEAIATLPQDEQASIIARGEKEILAAAKGIRARQRQARFGEASERLALISQNSKPLPTGQKFPIIYADPATRYVSGFGDRSTENHYPTMTLEQICALPVNDLATSAALLMIWTTIPHLRNTMTVIEAWGFGYVSAWCWDKVDQGPGHWAFNQHEELLIATRGGFPAPVPGDQPRSLYREKKTDHSVKPAWFAEQIEKIWPDLPKIELFARSPRPGWSAWGNQADQPAPPPLPSHVLDIPAFLKPAVATSTTGETHASHH
jgi:N6-adenosine-specific RNA methylase IME4